MTKSILIGYMVGTPDSGIDKYIINFIQTIYKNDIKIGILTNKKTEFLMDLQNQYKFEIHEIPSLKRPVAQVKEVMKIIKENNYNITYFNVSEASNILGLLAAWLSKAEKRIVHSHSSSTDTKTLKEKIRYVVHLFCKQFLYLFANRHVACSTKAACWLYPKKFVNKNKVDLVFNFIDTNKFKYSISSRKEMRESFGIDEDTLVLGHVANFFKVKNHAYAVEIFKELLSINENSLLLFAGDGTEKENIESLVNEYQLNDKIKFLGVRKDVDQLLQGFDALLLPSFYEGLPISIIEGQVSGVDCFISDSVTDEVKVADNCHFLSINESPKVWAEYILKNVTNREKYNFEDFSKIDKENQKIVFNALIN